MKITVIVCTYNRSRTLANTLEGVAASRVDDSVQWEVLVVDNNSTDRTREVVEDLCRRYPARFRYLLEPQGGKSYALNTAVRESRGDVLAFMDDDVTVEPTWIENLTGALVGGKWAGVGGRTLLAEAFSPPDWMTMDGPYSLGGILAALFDIGAEPCELDRPPYGANMAFRREMFEKHGLFRTDLGPSPDRDIPRPNEDTEFGRRLMAAGERLYYEPSAIVYHPLLENRIQKQYFLNWYFDYGRATVHEWSRGADIWGIPRHYLSILHMVGKCLPQRLLRWAASVRPRRRFSNKCGVWVMAGQIVETYRLGRDVKKQKDDHALGANIGSNASI